MRAHRFTNKVQRALVPAALSLVMWQYQAMADSSVIPTEALSTRSIPDLLTLIAAQKSDKNPAIVRVYLYSGAAFEGFVMLNSPETGTCSVIAENGQISQLSIREISAITIVSAGSARIALQGGKILRQSSDPIPTYLALRRRAEELSRTLRVPIQVALSESENPDCLFAADRVLHAFDSILRDITVDDDGRKSLAFFSGGFQIQQQTGHSMSVTAKDRAIIIGLDCAVPLNQGYEKQLTENVKRLL